MADLPGNGTTRAVLLIGASLVAGGGSSYVVSDQYIRSLEARTVRTEASIGALSESYGKLMEKASDLREDAANRERQVDGLREKVHALEVLCAAGRKR